MIILTYLLTPWCRVLLEKLTCLQLVKKFPAFHGTRRFITAHTSVIHLSLSRARPIQSVYPHPTSWRSILIFSTHPRLGLPSGLFDNKFIIFLYMFRALLCSSSGQNCIIQLLVSSHSVGGRRVHLCTGRPPTECDHTRCCIIQF